MKTTKPHHPRSFRTGLFRTGTPSRQSDLDHMIEPRFRTATMIERFSDDAGSVTAEYVIATLAAVSFAGLLVVIMRGEEVRTILVEMVRNALQFPG